MGTLYSTYLFTQSLKMSNTVLNGRSMPTLLPPSERKCHVHKIRAVSRRNVKHDKTVPIRPSQDFSSGGRNVNHYCCAC